MNPSKVCTACGTHYSSENGPEICPICQDDRQYVPEGGQTWLSCSAFLKTHSVRIMTLQPGVHELSVLPVFAIGQRALFIETPGGNILWDCIPLLDEGPFAFLKSKGGVQAIAFSHPHYYSNMSDWAEAFDCPIYIHQSDEPWVFAKKERINFWEGEERELWDGIRIVRIGGHFPGSSVLHVPALSAGGTIFCGDTLALSPSMTHLAVMYSYPNRIPLPLGEVRRVKSRFDTIRFDSLYGFYSYQNLYGSAREILEQSFRRYSE